MREPVGSAQSGSRMLGRNSSYQGRQGLAGLSKQLSNTGLKVLETPSGASQQSKHDFKENINTMPPRHPQVQQTAAEPVFGTRV